MVVLDSIVYAIGPAPPPLKQGQALNEARSKPMAALSRRPQAPPRRIRLRLHDGYETPVYVYDAADPHGHPPVLYVHGIQSHPGWFSGSGAFLAAGGHGVFQVTRRGSGENERDRGHAGSAEQLLRDVDDACLAALSATGASRLHLLGVSWGGKLLAAYASADEPHPHVASLVLVAPGIVPRVDVSTAAKLAIAAALLFSPRRQFDVPLSEVELFTDNEEMRRYLRTDGCRLQRATARFLYASRRLDRMLRRRKPGSLRVPTTLLLASRDRIIDSSATRRVVERLTAGRAVVQTFDAAHTLEFEPDPLPYYQALLEAVSRDG
jgi:alpha-beta hydrolase superfamily lysophospholipase